MRGAWIWAGGGAVLVAGLVLASLLAEPLAQPQAAENRDLKPPPVSAAVSDRALSPVTTAPAEPPAPPTPPPKPLGFAEAITPPHPEPTGASAVPSPARPRISLPADNDDINNAPEDPTHNVGVSHAGPEPLERDPCRIPLYFRGIERRKNLQAEDLRRLYVRVTVEGYTSTWRFWPQAEDEIYLGAWKKLDLTRVKKGEDGRLHVQVEALALGGAEVKDLDMVLGGQPMGGGVFGRGLMEKMRLTVDWEKGVARAEGCRSPQSQ